MDVKEFPQQYPPDVVEVIQKCSIDGTLKSIQVFGSASLKDILFPSDVDAFQKATFSKIKTKEQACIVTSKKLQKIIKQVNETEYVTDIKCGSIPEWVIIDDSAYIDKESVRGYKASLFRSRLFQLYNKNVISRKEYDEGKKLLVGRPTPLQFLKMKDYFKFHVIRWSVDEIEKGFKYYRGRPILLVECMDDPSIIKIDLIHLTDTNKYIEISVIYELKYGKDIPLNNFSMDIVKALSENVIHMLVLGKYWKSLKRMYSLLRYKKDPKAEEFIPIFNSNLGILSQIIADINTLVLLLNHTHRYPKKRIADEIALLPSRLANITQIKDLVMKEDEIQRTIQEIVDEKQPILAISLEKLADSLTNILNENAKPYIQKFLT